MMTLNLVYKRDGKEFQFIQVPNWERLNFWVAELEKLGSIEIIDVIIKDYKNESRIHRNSKRHD